MHYLFVVSEVVTVFVYDVIDDSFFHVDSGQFVTQKMGVQLSGEDFYSFLRQTLYLANSFNVTFYT